MQLFKERFAWSTPPTTFCTCKDTKKLHVAWYSITVKLLICTGIFHMNKLINFELEFLLLFWRPILLLSYNPGFFSGPPGSAADVVFDSPTVWMHFDKSPVWINEHKKLIYLQLDMLFYCKACISSVQKSQILHIHVWICNNAYSISLIQKLINLDVGLSKYNNDKCMCKHHLNCTEHDTGNSFWKCMPTRMYHQEWHPLYILASMYPQTAMNLPNYKCIYIQLYKTEIHNKISL
jgi:hypothetical protein